MSTAQSVVSGAPAGATPARRRWRVEPLAGALATVLALTGLSPVPAAVAGEPEEYLISVDGDAADFRRTVTSAGGIVEDVFGRLDVLAVTIPPAAAAALDRRPDLEVEPNFVVSALGTRTDPPSYGQDRIDQRKLPLSNTYSYPSTGLGAGVNVYVLDTGIRADHVQFGGRVAAGFGAVSDGRGTSDCNGHGTHVAGTIAGSTVGLAPDATLIPVRILDCDGSSSSGWDFMEGMDWILADHQAGEPAVLNMSIGAVANTMIDSAVAEAVEDGIVVVAAAGNDNTNACSGSPARAPSAITVAATSVSDSRASYSNYGSCVDLFAPGGDNGRGIKSAFSSSSTAYAQLMGTSMATPHVAGIAARYLSVNPAATPAQVASALLGSATPGVVTSAGTGSPNRLLYASPDGFAPSEGGGASAQGPTAPGAPTGVSAAPGGGENEALVSWTAPSETGGAAITEYVVTVSPKLSAGASSRSAGTATSLTFPGIDPGPHSFTVTASNGSGLSVPSVKSNTLTLTPGGLLPAAPVVKGAPAVGEQLSAAPGAWGPAPVTLQFQWLRNGDAIAGATSTVYRLRTEDAGQAIAVTVSGSKTGYTPASRTSAAVAVGELLTATPTPSIAGTARANSVLTARPGTWGPEPVTLRYQWSRSGRPISGATGSAYKVTTADAGRSLTVTVTGSKPGYSPASRTSAPEMVARIFTSKPTPKISGTAKVGATLRAESGTWGPSVVKLRYQWHRSGKPISGADEKTYVLGAADAGRKITVTVTGSKTGYGTVSKTSAARAVPG